MSSPNNTNRLSESQLTSAMSVGLYSDHSYLLQSVPADEYTLMQRLLPVVPVSSSGVVMIPLEVVVHPARKLNFRYGFRNKWN